MCNNGLGVHGGDHVIELPWPEIQRYPNFGTAKARASLYMTLAHHARATGAKLMEGMSVSGPVLHERTGRVIGVRVRQVDENGKRLPDVPERTLHAPEIGRASCRERG